MLFINFIKNTHMKIYTGNFANLKKYQKNDLFPISIALSNRYFNGATFRKLAPEWSFKDDEPNSYTRKFNEKLNKLDKNKILKELSNISQDKDIILLCHEKASEFCHRHLLNEWLSGNGEFAEDTKKQLSLL